MGDVRASTRADRAAKRARRSAPAPRGAPAVFRILDLPYELQSLIVEQMPLRTMARLALTHADWAAMVQCSLRHGRSWAQSYADHRCCHDLTGDARATVAPMGKWAWKDHLHVLEAVAVRAHPSEFSLLVEHIVAQEWWSSRFFDEEAASQAAARCLVGRTVGGVSPHVVLDLFGAFIGRRNPALRVVNGSASCAIGAFYEWNARRTGNASWPLSRYDFTTRFGAFLLMHEQWAAQISVVKTRAPNATRSTWTFTTPARASRRGARARHRFGRRWRRARTR